MIGNAYAHLSEGRDVSMLGGVHSRTCMVEECLEDLGDGGLEGLGQGL